ncbi:MAG TPA: PDZ domain-containing protein [Eubacteriaceae bacterium]|jgi:hypothetical protein|nr:PDZ domain-containing protein [Eubacteriaceae bacterium]
MNPILQALWMGILSLLQIIFHPLFWLVLYIISTQYKRQVKAELKILGMEKGSLIDKIINATLYGFLGGLVGSILMILIGVSIRQEGLIYLWPIAIILFLIKSRYLCFSYAGGIISVFSLIFGFPKIDVSGLMALVAVLHLVESFLIYTNGDYNSLPIIIDKGNGKHIGGYSLQRFWPIPIVIMTIIFQNQVNTETLIQMPDWWPIIKPTGVNDLDGITFIMISIVAALGYGDVVFTQLPKAKARESALKLGGYSLILLALSIVSSRVSFLQWGAALFAPIGHELLILHGRKKEEYGIPILTLPEKGIRVLEVLEGSASEKIGINRGDIIYSINNIPINNSEDIKGVLNQYFTFVWVEGETYQGERYTKELKVYPYGLRTLGIIVLPQYSDISYVMEERDGILTRLWEKYIKK